MKLMRSKISLFAIATLAWFSGQSQDVHFSQFYQTPLAVNPALTGVFNGNIRAVINYRDQWTKVAPYKSYGLSFDAGMLKKKMKDKYLGGGLLVYQDVAGDSKLSTTQVNLSLSSVISINDAHDISAGLQGGFAQKKVNNGSFQWGTQYDASGYNGNISSGETATFENYIFGDFNAGIAWSYGKAQTNASSNDHLSANAGFAVYHINAPKQAFDLEKLHREFVIHGGSYIGIKNTDFSILPSILYLIQGPLQEFNAGLLARYSIREESRYTGLLKETAIFFGCFYRAGDAVIPTFMFEFANYALGISYDINISGLKDATSGQGGLEISLRFINPNPFKYGKGSRYQHRSLF